MLVPLPNGGEMVGATSWMPQDTVGLVRAAAWPFAAMVMTAVAAWSKLPARLLNALRGGGVRSLEAFGVKVELSSEEARHAQGSFEDVLARYRELVDRRFRRLMSRERLDPLWEQLVREGVYRTFEGPVPDDLRCTLYVPDPLFGERVLYQLVDYYPKGGGRGRRLSWRFGAVGRAWRLEVDDVWRGVRTDVDDLVNEWGMSRAEADTAGRGRTAFGCVLLHRQVGPTGVSSGELVALLYMDSQKHGAFGLEREDPVWQARAAAIRQLSEQLGFAERVYSILHEVREVTPELALSPDSGGTRNAVP